MQTLTFVILKAGATEVLLVAILLQASQSSRRVLLVMLDTMDLIDFITSIALEVTD